MQLKQIESISAEPLETALHRSAKVPRRKILGERSADGAGQVLTAEPDHPYQRTNEGLQSCHESPLSRQHESCLARNYDFVTTVSKGAPKEDFALALTINVGGVEEIHAGIEGCRQQVEEITRIALEDAADTRAPESKFRNFQVCAAKAAKANIHVR
jgi:hypothetical protein